MDEDVTLDVNEEKPEQEKMLPVSRVNELVKNAKAAAAEKVRREMQAELQGARMAQSPDEMVQPMQQQMQQQAQPQGLGGMQSFNPAEVEQKIYERIRNEAQNAYRAQQEAQHNAKMQQIAEDYFLKMGKGPELFDDFGEVTKAFEPEAFPETVKLAAMMENTPELIYELNKNPHKLTAIEVAANKSKKMGQEMLNRLAKSIEDNKQAKQSHPETNEPLSRLKSSTVGADNGKLNLQDLKKMSWLKG